MKRKELERFSKQRRDKGPNFRSMLAIYDFFDLPFSNDIITFLARAELERKKNSFESITVVFISHSEDPSPPRHNYVNTENYKTYLHNLGFESTRLFPNVGSVLFFSNRNEWISFFTNNKSFYSVYPPDYNVDWPNETQITHRLSIHCHRPFQENASKDGSDLSVTPPRDAVEYARHWINKNIFPKIPVTITMRKWKVFSDYRLSNPKEWQNLLNFFEDLPVKFIVLKDFHHVMENNPFSGSNSIIWDYPVLNLSLRAALYQESSLNLAVNQGAFACAVYNRNANYVIFNILHKGRGGSEESLKRLLGLSRNDQFIGSNYFQRLVWEPINSDLILRETVDCLYELCCSNQIIPDCYKQKHASKISEVTSGIRNSLIFLKEKISTKTN